MNKLKNEFRFCQCFGCLRISIYGIDLPPVRGTVGVPSVYLKSVIVVISHAFRRYSFLI